MYHRRTPGGGRLLAVALPLMLILALAGCPTEEEPRSPVADPVHTDEVGPGGIAGELPPDLMEEVIQDAALQTGVPEDQIEVMAVHREDWEDGSLGCPEAFEDDDPTVAERGGSAGWQVFIDADGQELDYRVAEHRFFVLCEEAD